ncbi:hypothetical protein [Kitasatospora sp. NPDC004531]
MFPGECLALGDDESVDADDPRIDAVFTQGSVVLGSDDGQSFWLLVTAGPCRGGIWMVSDVGAIPVPGAEAWGFAEWVAHWQSGNGWWA